MVRRLIHWFRRTRRARTPWVDTIQAAVSAARVVAAENGIRLPDPAVVASVRQMVDALRRYPDLPEPNVGPTEDGGMGITLRHGDRMVYWETPNPTPAEPVLYSAYVWYDGVGWPESVEVPMTPEAFATQAQHAYVYLLGIPCPCPMEGIHEPT